MTVGRPARYLPGMPTPAASTQIGRVSIRKRGRYWYARYRPYRGAKQIQECLEVSTKEQASRKAMELNRLLDKGPEALEERKQASGTTFEQLADEFDANYRNWSETTRQGNIGLVRTLRDEFGGLPLVAVTSRLLRGYLSKRLDAGDMSKGTHNRYLAYLRRLFALAVEYGYLEDNPAEKIKYIREDKLPPKALTDEQLVALDAVLPEAYRPLLRFAVDTGLRRSELFGLRWDDVDWAQRQLIVRHSKAGEFRVVPFTQAVGKILEERRATLAAESVQDVRVWPFVDIKKALSIAGQAAGIGHVHLHQFRHTYATRLLDKGVPLDRIQTLLGHKSIVTTQRYARTRPEHLAEAVAALD